MNETSHAHHDPHKVSTAGRLLHAARAYDWLAWLLLGGKERAFRQKILTIARVAPGESILDVGCGTGTLAILAKKQAGPASVVRGIDASPEMIARAQKKARSAGVDVAFENGIVEALAFGEGTFDLVLSTLMLHHLPRAGREQCAREMRRVVKRGGRIVVVDFGARPKTRGLLLPRFHNHGAVDLREIVRVLTDAGLNVEETGEMGIHEIHYVIAKGP